MSLRRSPVLTPAALAARRANALKSTGPRTARGKAWSCLNALGHGRRSSNLRHRIERTGDGEALYLYDWLHGEIEQLCDTPSDWHWRRIEGLTVRAWCILTGRMPRWRGRNGLQTKLESRMKFVRYADAFSVPNHLKIINRLGCGLLLVSPPRWRRRRVSLAWVPQSIYLEGRPPKARRITRKPSGDQDANGRGAPGPSFSLSLGPFFDVCGQFATYSRPPNNAERASVASEEGIWSGLGSTAKSQPGHPTA